MKVACTVCITNSEESTKLILKIPLKCTSLCLKWNLIAEDQIRKFDKNKKIVTEVFYRTNTKMKMDIKWLCKDKSF